MRVYRRRHSDGVCEGRKTPGPPSSLLVLLVTAVLACGCGGAGNLVVPRFSSPDGGHRGGPATIVINFAPRAVDVTRTVVVGVDRQGHVQLGPLAAPWAAQRTIYPVPLSVTSVMIATATDTALVNVFSQAVTLTPGGVTIINEPEMTSASLVSMTIEPQAPVIAQGTTLAFTATGSFSDGRVQDLTPFALWTSSNESVARVSSTSPNWGTATGASAGTTTIVATVGSRQASTTLTVSSANLVGLTVTPPRSAVAVGYSRPLHAIGVFSDNTSQDLTQMASWTSSAPSVASVSDVAGQKGIVRGMSAGQSSANARALSSSSAGAVYVHAATLVSITVTPPQMSLAKGEEAPLKAVALFSDQTTLDVTKYVTWSSSNESVCTVSNLSTSIGLVAGVGAGSATVTASAGGFQGTSAIQVTAPALRSIVVNPAKTTVPAGYVVHYKATGIFSDDSVMDLTQSLTWSSQDPRIATVSNVNDARGVAHALAAGTTAMTARDPDSGIQGTATLEVSPAVLKSLQLTPTDHTLAAGYTVNFKAVGTLSDGTQEDWTEMATWTSSQPSIAAISNDAADKGQAAGLAPGSTSITATDPATGIKGATTLTVTSAVLQAIRVEPQNVTTPAGTTVRYTATGEYSDGTSRDLTVQVTWKSSNTGVAQVENVTMPGLATALSAGSTTITAVDPLTLVSGSTPLTITAPVAVSLVIEPAPVSLAQGCTLPLHAWATFSDGTARDVTEQATWISSAPAVCQVSNLAGSHGLLHALQAGSATVSASHAGLHASAPVTVTPAVLSRISVFPYQATRPVGVELAYSATGIYSDDSTRDLTQVVNWRSEQPGIATVSNESGSRGVATPVSAGSATIVAVDPDSGIQGIAYLTVTPAVLAEIRVSPAGANTPAGDHVDYTATGRYSDGTFQDLTASVSWSSSDASIVVVSNGVVYPPGRAVGVRAGSATITATELRSHIQGSQTLNVTAPVLRSLAITPAYPSLHFGTTLQFTATGDYSDGSSVDLTAEVAWSSSSSEVALVVPGGAGAGLLYARTRGQAVITAVEPASGIKTTTSVTVTGPDPVSLAIRPVAARVPRQFYLRYAATATYADGTTGDVTNQVTWESSSPVVASISAIGGHAWTGTGAGTTTIRATWPGTGISATTPLTVDPALTLLSLAVVPADQQLALGATGQVNAVGTFSDASTIDLTQSCRWGEGLAQGIEVSNTPGWWGFVTALKPGKSSAEARYFTHQGYLYAEGYVMVKP